jgi:hypothetical protein
MVTTQTKASTERERRRLGASPSAHFSAFSVCLACLFSVCFATQKRKQCFLGFQFTLMHHASYLGLISRGSVVAVRLHFGHKYLLANMFWAISISDHVRQAAVGSGFPHRQISDGTGEG